MRLSAIAPRHGYLVLGHLLFFGLAVLSMQYWRERTMQLDNACQIFKWINNHGLQVEAHRYSAILPQLFVKALASSGLSLPVLLKAASLVHVLVPWAIYAFIAHALRRPAIAIACALATVLCTRMAFYGPVLEAHYLLSYPFLFAALLDLRSNGDRSGRILVGSLLCLAAILVVHPLGALVALFVIALYFGQSADRRILYLLAALAMAWAAFGRSIFPPTGYEQGLYGALVEGFRSLLNGSQLPALDFLFGHTWPYTSTYLMLWALLATLLFFLVRAASWFRLAVVFFSVLGYILLITAVYHEGETAMMMEKNFLPLAVMVSLPFALLVAKWSERMVRWSVLPFAVVLFLQFRGVSFASREVHARLELLEGLVGQAHAQEVSNALVAADLLDARGLHIHWALGYETLLLSAADGADRALVIHAADLPGSQTELDIEGVRYESHRIVPEDLDPQWFRPPQGDLGLLSERGEPGATGPWTDQH